LRLIQDACARTFNRVSKKEPGLTSISTVFTCQFFGQIEKPTDEQIDEWHKKYTSELQRLFAAYKHVRPDYKNKDLRITEK